MRTPDDDHFLVRGLLLAEGIYKKGADIKIETVSTKLSGEAEVNVSIPVDQLGDGFLNKRSLLSVSSCGICGKRDIEGIKLEGEAVKIKGKVNLPLIEEMYVEMQTQQESFNLSGGCHAAGLFSIEGKLLSLKEDIGRHNAVDKVVGEVLSTNSIKEAKILLLSGRVSYEIIIKAFKAKIPIVCAISAPSSLAVDYAKEFGITLLGFCRKGKATCYALY